MSYERRIQKEFLRFRIKRNGWATIILEGDRDIEFQSDDIDQLIEMLTLVKTAFPTPTVAITSEEKAD